MWHFCTGFVAIFSIHSYLTGEWCVGFRNCSKLWKVSTFNSLAPGRCGCNLKSIIFKLISRISLASPVKLPSGECHKTSLMISQYWFRWWHQAITWASVDPDLCHDVASLGYNELIFLRYIRVIFLRYIIQISLSILSIDPCTSTSSFHWTFWSYQLEIWYKDMKVIYECIKNKSPVITDAVKHVHRYHIKHHNNLIFWVSELHKLTNMHWWNW